jgi:quaternary ammonium compound-resistance protein SugE
VRQILRLATAIRDSYLSTREATTSPNLGTMSGRPGDHGGPAMAWLYLFSAGILEIVWAFTMKQSDGFTRPMPTVITIITMIGSFALLSLAMRSLPLGTAYTIWTGIGAVGAFVVGVTVLGEALTPMRIAAATLIVSGLVMMKLSAS